MRKTHVEKKHQGGRIALYVISMVLLLGVFSGEFTAASAGLGAAVVAGLIVSLLCKPKDKGE